MTEEMEDALDAAPEVAVIGMAGRFPGADDLHAFWRNLRDGVECIRTYTDEELIAAGAHPSELASPAYVRSGAHLSRDVVQGFDAAFFGYSPREAETLEPGHRLFLECCWEALEAAGYDPARAGGAVGVFAGAGVPHYTDLHVRPRRELAASVGEFQLFVGSGKDFVATRAAYKLNLRGPAVSVQTGCSTSLVAVHQAAQALLHGECEMALAGGTNVVGTELGYHYSAGGINSPDGHCRAFDADAAGTFVGSGVGAVLLKRLDDAVRDGDTIHAVIKGSAVNNDGAQKVAFTAPSVEGQAAVIREALEVADVHPETIRYIEGHGSGTELGDPIEIAALTQAYRSWTGKRQFAAVGSVKTNVGHLDAAAGIAGFLKAVLAVENGEVPPTVHFRAPNPKIDFASSPFYVSAQREPWGMDDTPRRAAVSSFGIGGTNAHVVIEQAPETEPSGPARDTRLWTLSARTPSALDAATDRLAAHLRAHPDLNQADAEWTLQIGRREMAFRRVLVSRDGEDAASLFDARHPERVVTAAVEDGHRSVVFLFPGVGDQYPQMARGLYDSEPVFRAEVDRCAEILTPHLGLDLREALFPGEAAKSESKGIDFRAMLGRAQDADPAADRLNRTELAQPAVFVIEYALARTLMAWGIVPEAVIGHSVGEYAAACIAGIFSLEDALALVAKRAALIGALPGGAMLAVPLAAEAVAPFLVDGATVATMNAPSLVVVAGSEEAVAEVQRRLEAAGHAARRLAATHAFHSPAMDPVVQPVTDLVRSFRLRAPRIPLASNVTGTWITPAEATDPGYWGRHLRQPVRFDRGIGEVLRGAGRVLVEVGPGQTLSTFVRQRGEGAAAVPVIPTVRYPYDKTPDASFLLGALGRLWLAGVTPDWTAFHQGESRRRVPLPTYPWERQRYFLDLATQEDEGGYTVRGRESDPGKWLFVPSWRRTPIPVPATGDDTVLVFGGGDALTASVVDSLRARGRSVILARAGDAFAADGDSYALRPASRDDLRRLSDELAARIGSIRNAIYLWTADAADAAASARAEVGALAAVDAFGRQEGGLDLLVVTRGAVEVGQGDAADPARAGIAGALAAVPSEYPGTKARVIDLASADSSSTGSRVADEALGGGEPVVALRGRHRWVRAFEPASAGQGAEIRRGGAYVFVGGLYGRNGVLADHLAREHGARIGVVDPTLPHRGGWDAVVKARLPEDPLRAQIEFIRALDAAGVHTVTVQAIPEEVHQMDAALRQIEAEFGRIDGVVYAPTNGMGSAPATLGEIRQSPWEKRIAFLLAELRGVAQAIGERRMDFVLAESSLAPVIGGIGVADAAATHAAIEAFASAQADAATPWTAAAWDRWSDDLGEGEHGMREADALAAFHLLVRRAGEPVVLLSTGHPEARLREAAEAPRAGSGGGSYERPELATEYHAPDGPVEEAIAQMWEELLGISPIGAHDDFFALGGHSLLATQIVSRCRDTLGLELPLKTIFEAPTISRFAAVVEEMLVAEIEAMSDEEALALTGAA